MSRTNIDIDDELVAIVMNRFNLPTKKSAVDMALRRLVVETDQMKLIDSIFGIGWDGPEGGRFTDELHSCWFDNHKRWNPIPLMTLEIPATRFNIRHERWDQAA